jgi:hypothetical protein
MTKTCPECNEPIVGRIDKKFCSRESNHFRIISDHIVSYIFLCFIFEGSFKNLKSYKS